MMTTNLLIIVMMGVRWFTFCLYDADYVDDVDSFCATMSGYEDVNGYKFYDTDFLMYEVWPRVQSIAYCHDSFSCRTFAASHPFPVQRQGTEHLGQRYDQFSVGYAGDANALRKTPVNFKCVRHRHEIGRLSANEQ